MEIAGEVDSDEGLHIIPWPPPAPGGAPVLYIGDVGTTAAGYV